MKMNCVRYVILANLDLKLAHNYRVVTFSTPIVSFSFSSISGLLLESPLALSNALRVTKRFSQRAYLKLFLKSLAHFSAWSIESKRMRLKQLKSKVFWTMRDYQILMTLIMKRNKNSPIIDAHTICATAVRSHTSVVSLTVNRRLRMFNNRTLKRKTCTAKIVSPLIWVTV